MQSVATRFAGDQQAGERSRPFALVVRIQQGEHLKAALAMAQVQVGNHEVGCGSPVFHGVQRLGTVFGGGHVATPAAQQIEDARQDRRLVVHYQHAHARNIQRHGRQRVGVRLRCNFRQHETENAAAVGARVQLHVAADQFHQSLDGGEAQPQAAPRAVAGRRVAMILNAVELVEHARLVLRRDADAGVPHIHPNLVARTSARGHQHATLARVAQRVADQVVEDAAQHGAVAAHPHVRGAHHQPQVVLFGDHAEVAADFIENLVQRKVADLHLHRAGLQPRQVEQLAEQVVERLHALLDMRDAVQPDDVVLVHGQRGGKQGERV